MVSRASAGPDLQSTAATLTTSNAILQPPVKASKSYQHTPTTTPLPLASSSETAFDVLLVIVSVVSTLFLVTLVLLVLVLRLLRRVTAAAATASAARHAHTRYSTASEEDDSADAEHQREVSSTTEDAQPVSDDVREQQPLLSQQQQQRNQLAQTRHDAQQQQQRRRRRRRRRQRQRQRIPASPSLFNALQFVLGFSGHHDRLSTEEEQRGFYYSLRSHSSSSSSRAYSRHGRSHRHRESRRNRRHASFDNEHGEAGVEASRLAAPRATHRHAHQSSQADHTRSPGQPIHEPTEHQRELAQAEHKAHAAATAVANDGEAAMPFHATTQKDLVVFNTTHDSRYRLLQRIGMGAFSSVYLVQHKTTGQKYALKYILCKDDRERLAALRECEVMHSLQGHPQVIRIVDMFMNFQFQSGGGGFGKPAASVAGAFITRHPTGLAPAAVPAAAARAALSLSSVTRPSQPWQVTSTGNPQLRNVSPHVARSLTQSPSLWARPNATPTSPLLLCASSSPHAASATSLAQQSSQQQQQQKQQLSPLLPSANAPTSQFRPTGNTRQAAGAGNVDAAAAFSRPSYAPSSAPNVVTAALLRSAVASPATPSSPVHNPPTAGAARTTWVGVQLQGLQDAVMAKVSTATELEDAEVATALRARLRTAGADSLRGDGDDAMMRVAEQKTSMRRNVDYSVNNYSTNNNRNRNGEEDDETDEADGASELDGSGVDSDHLTDPDNAPLILSAADTERLLMDARLLQQRRHRQRAHHRRLRQQKKSSPPDATNSTTLPVARGRGAAALSEFGETRSMSLSSLHQQQQQQQGLQQISVQHTSRSSSSVSRAMNRPHDGSLYGPPRGLPSPTTSSCSNTRGSLPTANVPSPCTYMPQQQQQQPSATALRYNVENNNNNNSNSRFSNYTTSSGVASAPGPVNYSTAPHYSSNAKNARDLISSTEARASPQPQPQPPRQHDVPLTGNDSKSPLNSNVGTRSTSSRRNVDAVSGRSESSAKSNVSAGERRLSDEEAKRHHYSRQSEGSKEKESTCSSSSDNTSSGSEEEPIQPIRRILVPPPSYMHPPPGFAPSSPIEGKRQEGAASPTQPSSPTSYVSRNRYANFTMNADAALVDNITTTGADAQDTTTAAVVSTATAAEVHASRRVSPALELSAVGGEAVGVHEDVDAPSPAAAAAAAAASAAATEAAKARASYAPRKQMQQQQQNFPSPALSYAPAAATSLTSIRPANSYAPARAAVGALSPAAQSHAAASEAEEKKAVAASNPASPAVAPTPTATQQTIPEAEMTKPGETEQTIESETRTPSPKAASGVAEATNRSGDAVKSNTYPISSQVNNYAPARDSRVSHYINPYLERACGGEVVPPPRTSYAPGGGVRYNGLVAPASTAPVASYAPPSTPSATVTAAAATSGSTSAVCHRGPIVRAWNDGSALAQPTTKAVTTTASTATTKTTIEEEVKQISAGADHSTEPSTTKAEQEPQQQSTTPSSLITRNTYAPLRYGNLAQSTTTAVSAKPERTSTPASPLAPEAQSTTPAGTGTPVATPAAPNEVAVSGSAPPAPLPAPSTVGASSANSSSGGATCKATPGRLSVSAAIRSARAGQQGERMHLNDGKPHVHVPTPNPEGGLVPPRPFTNPNELNRTHVVYGHLRNERGEGSNEGSEQDAMTQSNGTFAYPNYTYSNNNNKSNSAYARNGGGDVTAYVDAPTPQKPLYTNLGVTLTEEAPPVAESAAAYPHPHTAVYSNSTHTTAVGAHGAGRATATSHLFRDTAGAASGYAGGVPSYGATNATNNNNNNNNNDGSTTYATYAPRGATYAPAVRYANAGNPTLWCAYGQPGGAAIGPASVAAARATAAVLRGSNGGKKVNDTDNDSDGSREDKTYHGDATTVDGTATSRKHNKNGDADDDKNSSAAGTASTTQSNSSGSLTQDVRDTGYLCLVMEYHPMGDLCHYVLRAKQQLALQQQHQEQPQQQSPYYMLRNSVSHNTFDARTNASPNTPTPSDNSSVLYAVTNAAGASYNNNNNYLHGDPNSPTVLLGSSTASWMAAAAAASWRMRPAASRSDPNLAVAASAAIGNGNGNIDATTGRTRGEEDDKRDPTSRNPLTEPQLLSIAYQLSSVLDHMHHQSPPIIHRDLKPENILIKGELTEFLEDVPAEAVLGLNGVAGPGSQCASKPASPLSPAAAAATASGPHGTGRTSLKENGNSTSIYQRADRASATPQSPSIPSNRGLSLNPAATAATAAAGPAAGSTPGLSLAAPPPIRITRAVVPIVVTDFGLAMLQEHHSGHRSGSRGGGTRPYIAPECWQGATCTASDMWSLGCVLYALATTRLTARTVRLMSEEAKRDGFASRMLNDIISHKYSLAFASFVVSLLVVDPAKRPTAAQAAQCFLVTENEVRFDSSSPFFSNVLDL